MDITQLLAVQQCWYEHIPHDPTYSAQRLAHELHVSGREVAKTVLLRAGMNGRHEFIVAVVPANKNVDFERVARIVGAVDVQLATELEISAQCPDCDFGVLPPFGSQYGMKTLVDSSLAEDEEVWFEGNTHKDAIRMKFDDYRRLEGPLVGALVYEN
jgi:Ala-tRNA(Pro) deacylase